MADRDAERNHGVKAGRLLVRWSEREKDFLVTFPDFKSTGGFAIGWLTQIRVDDGYPGARTTRLSDEELPFKGRTFAQEMESRGYDPKTLRFQIDKLED